MKTYFLTLLSLCSVVILTTVTSGVSQKEAKEEEEEEKEVDTSRRHALVALDSEISDETDSDYDVGSFVDKNAERFIPTRDWQPVKEGQPIPSGLHIRLNLQTGEREAKLIDNEENDEGGHHYATESNVEEPTRHERMKRAMIEAMKDLEEESAMPSSDEQLKYKYWKTSNKRGMINLDKPSFTHGELKQALKKFKTERDDVEVVEGGQSSAKGFRTMDEIRADFKTMHLDVKTDLEILSDIMQRYRSTELDHKDRLSLLTDLEYYVHQIDNARNFADMDGILLVVRDLNSTDEEVRAEAALVLASAVQSNPKVQVDAFDAGAIQKLIRMLSTEESVKLRSRVLTALSSLIRQFPFAQQKFLDLGGMQSLSGLLRRADVVSEKLGVKAVTLVNDLLTEQLSTQTDELLPRQLRNERLNQYSKVPLLESVLENGWCRLVVRFLDASDSDVHEKILSAMLVLNDHCRTDFATAVPRLTSLRQEYEELSRQERAEAGDGGVDDGYFNSMLRNVRRLLDEVHETTKDEL